MRCGTLLAVVLTLMLVQTAAGQKWPSKIRGYKVYDAKIDLSRDAALKLAAWRVAEIGFSGATIEVDAAMLSKKQGGEIEFVTFSDFKVNGIPVEIEEYKNPFTIKKGQWFALPKPAQVYVRMTNIPQAAFRELTEVRGEMVVAGTAFVFGKFKKFGFTFKRVVPIKIELTIPNPLIGQNRER